MAIGASRARIVGTAMRESGLVAVAGAAIGVLAAAGLATLFKVTFSTLPRLDEVRLDWRAVAFSTAAIAIATLVCGLLPVWHITRGRLQSTVASGGRSVSSGRHGLQQLLVVGQIALSLLLVGAAGMLLRSYYNLSHVAMGFDADDVVTFRVGAAWNEDRPRIGRLQERLVAELRERPGIDAAGITSFLPATGATLRSQITVEGVVGPEANGAMTVGYRTISAGYLQALRVPLLQGQWCPDLRMDFNVPRQVLVNRQFVDTFGDGQRLIGRELRVAQSNWSGASIAGVVGNVVEDGQSAGHAPYVYACDSAGSWPDPVYVVRTRDASALMGGIREIVNRLDSTRAVFSVRSLPDVMRQSLNQPRLDAQLLTTFAVAALALAALGLYSLFMLLVAERARELGVRMALGAAPGDLLRLVFGGAGRLIAAGVLAGLILTLAASRVLQVVLFGVSALDVPTLASALAVLVIVAFVAVTLPALRAARIDPIEAIRTE
jgi:predicted permease